MNSFKKIALLVHQPVAEVNFYRKVLWKLRFWKPVIWLPNSASRVLLFINIKGFDRVGASCDIRLSRYNLVTEANYTYEKVEDGMER